MKGSVKFIEYNRVTGEVLNVEEDHNVVVLDGMDEMLRAFTQPLATGNINNHIVRTFKIGSDVGNGTDMEPEEPDWEYDGTEQNVLYALPDGSLEFTSVENQEVTVIGTIQGSEVLNQNPGNSQVEYFSIGMYTGNGTLVAYRRFPERIITEVVNVRVEWTIGFDDCGVISGNDQGDRIQTPIEYRGEFDEEIWMQFFEDPTKPIARFVESGDWTPVEIEHGGKTYIYQMTPEGSYNSIRLLPDNIFAIVANRSGQEEVNFAGSVPLPMTVSVNSFRLPEGLSGRNGTLTILFGMNFDREGKLYETIDGVDLPDLQDIDAEPPAAQYIVENGSPGELSQNQPNIFIDHSSPIYGTLADFSIADVVVLTDTTPSSVSRYKYYDVDGVLESLSFSKMFYDVSQDGYIDTVEGPTPIVSLLTPFEQTVSVTQVRVIVTDPNNPSNNEEIIYEGSDINQWEIELGTNATIGEVIPQ